MPKRLPKMTHTKKASSPFEILKNYWNNNFGEWKEDIVVFVYEFKLIAYDSKLFEDHPSRMDFCGHF